MPATERGACRRVEYLIDVFRCDVIGGELESIGGESIGFRWCTADELETIPFSPEAEQRPPSNIPPVFNATASPGEDLRCWPATFGIHKIV